LSLAHARHPHHHAAASWIDAVGAGSAIHFCRITQLGLLRTLTTHGAMGIDTMTQAEAWAVYGRFFEDDRICFIDEPRELERAFRRNTDCRESSPKHWADAYLAAFAEVAVLDLVTFDQALAGRTRGAILLTT
jgi:hypothetical protein